MVETVYEVLNRHTGGESWVGPERLEDVRSPRAVDEGEFTVEKCPFLADNKERSTFKDAIA
jgi:hypothetical protein